MKLETGNLTQRTRLYRGQNKRTKAQKTLGNTVYRSLLARIDSLRRGIEGAESKKQDLEYELRKVDLDIRVLNKRYDKAQKRLVKHC